MKLALTHLRCIQRVFLKMAEYLSRVQQSSLIELYHAQPLLWESTHIGYKDQNLRHNALVTIQTLFVNEWGITLDIRDIKTKIQSFRTAVSREMSRIMKWQSDAGPNDVYKPSYAHWHELQFLTAVIRKRDPSSDMASAYEPDDKTRVQENSLLWLNSFSQQDDSSFQLSAASSESPTPQSQLLVQATTPQPVTIHVAPVETRSQPATRQLQPATVRVAPIDAHVRPETPPQVRPIHSTSQQGQRTTPHTLCHVAQPFTSSPSCTNKRCTDVAEDSMRDSAQQCVQSKNARLDSGHSARGTEERYMVWARNLIEQLKLVDSENKRIALQIQINRLVQDEIMRQMDQE